MKNVNLAQLPSVLLTERKSLPDASAIYFALSPTDEVLYIGRTVSLFTRWQTHHRLTQLQGISGVRIAWLIVDDTSLLPDIERALIKYFNPALNRTRVPRIEGQKITIAFKVERRVWSAIRQIAKDEGRTISNTVERLLKTHPRIKAAVARTT